eukprot:6470407-Amphidinium_carterae.1
MVAKVCEELAEVVVLVRREVVNDVVCVGGSAHNCPEQRIVRCMDVEKEQPKGTVDVCGVGGELFQNELRNIDPSGAANCKL